MPVLQMMDPPISNGQLSGFSSPEARHGHFGLDTFSRFAIRTCDISGWARVEVPFNQKQYDCSQWRYHSMNMYWAVTWGTCEGTGSESGRWVTHLTFLRSTAWTEMRCITLKMHMAAVRPQEPTWIKPIFTGDAVKICDCGVRLLTLGHHNLLFRWAWDSSSWDRNVKLHLVVIQNWSLARTLSLQSVIRPRVKKLMSSLIAEMVPTKVWIRGFCWACCNCQWQTESK